MIEDDDWERLEEIAELLRDMDEGLRDADVDVEDEVCLEAGNVAAIASGFIVMFEELQRMRGSGDTPSRRLH